MLLLENRHSIGHIDDIMEILYINNKGRLMDTIDKYYIYKETKNGNQINDKKTVNQNKICDAVIQVETGRSPTRNTYATVNFWEYNNEVRYLAGIFIQHVKAYKEKWNQKLVESELRIEDSFLHILPTLVDL